MKHKIYFAEVGILFLIFFAAYIVSGGGPAQSKASTQETSDGFLASHIKDWGQGDWWVVKQVIDDSMLTGVLGDSNTVYVKYEVVSEIVSPIKKKPVNGNPHVTYYVVRETYLSSPENYRDIFYISKNGKDRILYKTESHYTLRDQNILDEEYYITDRLGLPIVTPEIAGEMAEGDKKIRKEEASFSEERKGEKHSSGLNFGEVSKITVQDGTSVKVTQLSHDSTPWPIYEKTSYRESELLDYSGWHELSLEALEKIPQTERDKAKADSKIFKSG